MYIESSGYTMIYSVDERGGKGNNVPICQQGHPGTSGYIDHREEEENRREEEREKRREKRKRDIQDPTRT